jgi:light-regulated signal transduction histidine kinase (bacteriophytochrome)
LGLAEQHHQRIFFRFFQRLHTQKRVSGTGIGLAICQSKLSIDMAIALQNQNRIEARLYFSVPVPK